MTRKITITAADGGMTVGELRAALEGINDDAVVRAQTTITGRLTSVTLEGVDDQPHERIHIEYVNLNADGTAETVVRLPDGRRISIPGGRLQVVDQ